MLNFCVALTMSAPYLFLSLCRVHSSFMTYNTIWHYTRISINHFLFTFACFIRMFLLSFFILSVFFSCRGNKGAIYLGERAIELAQANYQTSESNANAIVKTATKKERTIKRNNNNNNKSKQNTE